MADDDVIDEPVDDVVDAGDDGGDENGNEDPGVTPKPGVSVAAPEGDGPAADSDGAPDGDPPAEGDEHWRERYAGGDDKRLKQLQRYKSEQAFIESAWEAKSRIREGLPKVPDENSTDEEWAAYREENNIPVDPGSYEISMPEEMQLSDADKPWMEEILPVIHKNGLSNEAATELAIAYKTAEQAQIQARHDADIIAASQVSKTLRESYGADYQSNRNLFDHMISQMPEEAQEQFKNARGLDGTPLVYNVGFVDSMIEMARKVYPSVTVVPNSDNPMASAKEEVEELEKLMDGDDWHSEAMAPKRKRYMELIEYLEGDE